MPRQIRGSENWHLLAVLSLDLAVGKIHTSNNSLKELPMNRKIIPTLAITLATFVLALALWPSMQKGLALISNPQAITDLVHQSGIWGTLTLIVLLILQVFLAFIPGQALMIASGYIYGFWGGTLLTWSALTLGGQMAFWMARRYGRPFAHRFVSPDILARWDRIAARQGIGFYVVTLVLPLFPNDAMCYVAGLSEIHSRRFLVANVLGRLLATAAMTFVGAYGSQIPLSIWIVLAIALGLGTLVWYVFKNKSFFLHPKNGGSKCQSTM
jgi:uncharacterized membrane protein YdjX (TVP38/TMEM64 family)